MTEKLEQHIISRFGKRPPHLEDVLNAFNPIRVKRNQMLLRESEVCQHIYFVAEGSLQIEAITEAGDMNILGFIFENNWYTAMQSFQNQTPSPENIVASEKSHLLKLHRQDFLQLKENIPEFGMVYGQVLEESYSQFMQRINTLMSMDATDRMKWFYQQHPTAFTRLNSNIIANYLKIRPETFSRLKPKLFNS